MTKRSLLEKTIVLLVGLVIWLSPALAKNSTHPCTDIFTPPADSVSAPSYATNKNTQTKASQSFLDGNDGTRFDILRTLPDLTPDQSKALNKLEQETRKAASEIRDQINEAQKELNALKARQLKSSKSEPNPAMALLNPDDKSYRDPMLGGDEVSMEQAAESADDVQAQISELKDRIRDLNGKTNMQSKNILTPKQLGELDLMRQGRLVVDTPKTVLVDNPNEPSPNTAKNKHGSKSTNNSGARLLRTILGGAKLGIRSLE
jgi:Spy/CpxP family protein refolding chaperone